MVPQGPLERASWLLHHPFGAIGLNVIFWWFVLSIVCGVLWWLHGADLLFGDKADKENKT